MSYKRSYSTTIAVHYSGTAHYSYPASEHGGSGSVSYSGTAYENVSVDILVDTTPFDASVDNCNHHVDALTGSVIATEAAQVKSIQEKGKQIGDTVVNGFFTTVKFEISTQIVELQKQVEAYLLKMGEMQKRLIALKSQMEKDYHHTSERYAKIFADLNKELDNRIHALDQPVFETANNMYAAEDRFMESDMLNIVTLAAKENTLLDAQINTAIAKTHARQALNEANTFLSKKLATEHTLEHCKMNDARELKYYAPVCYASITNEHNVTDDNVYASEMLPEQTSRIINDKLNSVKLKDQTAEEKENVDIYFQNLVNETNASDEHAQRVKNLISKLYSM